MLRNSKKLRQIIALVLLFMCCLSGCAADKPEPVELTALSFYVPEIAYLGTSAEAMFAELEKTGDWPTLRDQTGEYDLKWAIRETPVVVAGNEYIENIISGGQGPEPVPWAINLERNLTVTDAAEISREAKVVYDLMVSELGEPEPLVDPETALAAALSEVIDLENTQGVEAWWVLETDRSSDAYPDSKCCLACALVVTPHHGMVTISVHYYLQSEVNFYKLTRFAEK